MSVKDVIKESVYSGFFQGADWNYGQMMVMFLIASIVGLYIFYLYRKICNSSFYSKDMNITMVGIVVVVAAIMLAMQSSLIVSLGMVGALSIVRFRNAVKNPMDLMFLFWAVGAGIICGVGLYLLVVVLCVVMTVMVLILTQIPNTRPNGLLVIHDFKGNVDWKSVKEYIKKNSKFMKEKSRNVMGMETELILEIKPTDEEKLLKELQREFGLQQIKYLTYDGEYRG